MRKQPTAATISTRQLARLRHELVSLRAIRKMQSETIGLLQVDKATLRKERDDASCSLGLADQCSAAPRKELVEADAHVHQNVDAIQRLTAEVARRDNILTTIIIDAHRYRHARDAALTLLMYERRQTLLKALTADAIAALPMPEAKP